MQLLTSRQGEVASMLNGFPQLRSTIWFSEASQQAAVQSLTPQMTENSGKVCLDSLSLVSLQGRDLPVLISIATALEVDMSSVSCECRPSGKEDSNFEDMLV